MDTKSRKFSQLMAVRVIAFLLCVGVFVATVIGTVLMALSFRGMDYVADIDDLFGKSDYMESVDLQYEFDNRLNHILALLDTYKSEEYISSGKLIRESEMDDALQELFYTGEYSSGGEVIVANKAKIPNAEAGSSVQELRAAVEAAIEAAFLEEEINEEEYELYMTYLSNDDWAQLPAWTGAGAVLEAERAAEVQNGESAAQYDAAYPNESDFGDPAVRDAFIKANQEQIAQIRKHMIKDGLRAFAQMKKDLEAEGFTYYATDGTYTVTNLDLVSGAAVTAEAFKKEPAYFVYASDTMEKEPVPPQMGGWVMSLDADMESMLDGYYNDNLQVYFSFNEDFIAAKQADYTAAKQELVKWLPLVLGGALLTLLLFLWLAVTTGGKGPDGRRKLYKADKLWTELQLGGVALAVGLGVASMDQMLYSYYGYYNYIHDSYVYMQAEAVSPLDVGLASAVGALLTVFGLWFILSSIRLLKAGVFLKNSLIYKICAAIGRAIMAVYQGGSVMRKVVLVTLAVCLLSATVFLAPVVFVAILVFAPKWVKKYEAVKQGVDEVKSGNLTYKIPITGNGELDGLARGINEISEASNIAVQNELKNQRMKTELISNVSHDLKTPLTSMVTYIDLLKTEGLASPNAPEYLEVLDQKTNRLRQLTEDLFEAAKASSGAMPVRMERVEMLSLINQGLGEFDQRIRESELNFIVSAPKEKYYVWADGQLLWRVVENLLSNALKYAQEGTRVYINLSERGGSGGEATMVVMEIKNISKQALNIDADELMERFKRGDESRTTEGSGLGLAIAKDLVKLQNGWFELTIDGDLFKATVMLAKHAPGPAPAAGASEPGTPFGPQESRMERMTGTAKNAISRVKAAAGPKGGRSAAANGEKEAAAAEDAAGDSDDGLNADEDSRI